MLRLPPAESVVNAGTLTEPTYPMPSGVHAPGPVDSSSISHADGAISGAREGYSKAARRAEMHIDLPASCLSFTRGDEQRDISDLVQALDGLNMAIDKIAIALVSAFNTQALCHGMAESTAALRPERRHIYTSHLVDLAILRNAKGQDVFQPAVTTMLNMFLFEHIFRPFCPGIEKAASDILQMINCEISKIGM